MTILFIFIGLFIALAIACFFYHLTLADAYDDVGLLGGFGAIAAALALGIVAAVLADSNDRDRLMRQCMADGHKEYECVSMLKQDVVPVIIPMGR